MDYEKKILQFWKEKDIFAKTENRGDKPFIFYDGPPFATGLPHYGHLLASAIKDAIPRYHVMRGEKLHRRWGWDCHGLPVENVVEKELNLKTKKDIESYGIEKFNDAAKKSVLRYTEEWKEIIPRFGRFVDMEHDYRTMDPSYTESIWWAFKTLYDKGLIYEGYKPMHICPRCETTLANFEVNQGYKDVTDISVTVKFPLVDEKNTFFLAWTTTPWTLPGNVALAVSPDLIYIRARVGSETYILSKDRASYVLTGEYEVLGEMSGAELVGKKYLPPFTYFSDDITLAHHERGWAVYAADFVTAEDGTGIVHIAPAFGEDDMVLGQREELPFVQHVGMDGRFGPIVNDFSGMQVKSKDDPQATDILVLKYLAGKNLLFSKEKITHSYPHCWRCDTPLLNYAASSWFVKVTALKDELLKANETVTWIPSHIKEGRFGKWLEGARDWAISRSRFWGAPLPVWRCNSCNELKVVGSLKELGETKILNNTYYVLRHGETEANLFGRVSADINEATPLTPEGIIALEKSAEELKEEKPDIIIFSPFPRTKESARVIASVLGISSDEVMSENSLLGEVNTGSFSGGTWEEYWAAKPEDGEKRESVADRIEKFLKETESHYQGKRILIVSHGLPLFMMTRILEGEGIRLETGELHQVTPRVLPHNAAGDIDLHRPYIDAIQFPCSCGGTFTRVPEVFDCWFESGSMPFAEAHHPFEEHESFDPTREIGYPADFIAEGLDQTRGWFYSMLVLGVGLFDSSPYRHVIVNGLILAEDGQKMSKRLKNYPDPVEVMERYGADALRFYLLSSPVVRAEDLNFSEKSVAELYRKNVVRLLNVRSFFELYRPKEVVLPDCRTSTVILDRWIRARLQELISEVTEAMESYELDRATKPITLFIDDLSTWYLRRSRDRFKDEHDTLLVSATLTYVLKETAKIIAPFMPFLAEDIYLSVKDAGDVESVHLSSWPEVSAVETETLEPMKNARELVSLALKWREREGIKIRQPLAVMKVKTLLPEEYVKLIRDEVNVKEVLERKDMGEPVWLDTILTPELREEGTVRDLIRGIQDFRKGEQCLPAEKLLLTVYAKEDSFHFVEKHHEALEKATKTQMTIHEGDGLGTAIEAEGVHLVISR